MSHLPTDLDEPATDLTELMARVVDDLHPPVDRLRRGSVSQGRRLRRRRQGIGVLGGVAAATAVVVLVAPGVRGPAAGDPIASDPSPVSPAPVSATPLPGTEQPAGFWQMPSTVMRDQLRSLLPPGAHLSNVQLTPGDAAPGDAAVDQGWLRATVTRDGIAGESAIELMLRSPGYETFTLTVDPSSGTDPGADSTATTTTASDSDLIACPGNLVDPTSCTEIDQHGRHVGRSADVVDGALTQHLVTVQQGAGQVYVAVANTTDDKWGPTSATSGEAPALTSDELVAIASSSSWADWTPPAG